jgi:hypothetical protein
MNDIDRARAHRWLTNAGFTSTEANWFCLAPTLRDVQSIALDHANLEYQEADSSGDQRRIVSALTVLDRLVSGMQP